MSSSEPERMLLHYRLLHKVDSGGMGEIYKAEDTKLNRTVAIKLLLPNINQESTARRRFLQEAQSASALNHPNIVTIHCDTTFVWRRQRRGIGYEKETWTRPLNMLSGSSILLLNTSVISIRPKLIESRLILPANWTRSSWQLRNSRLRFRC